MSEWISVKDRLPKIDEEVLVCFTDGFNQIKFGVAWTISIDGWSGYFGGNITHWMPLPEPPEVE